MADQQHTAESRGRMDISDHVTTWHYFSLGVKWALIGGVVLAVLLAIFRT